MTHNKFSRPVAAASRIALALLLVQPLSAVAQSIAPRKNVLTITLDRGDHIFIGNHPSVDPDGGEKFYLEPKFMIGIPSADVRRTSWKLQVIVDDTNAATDKKLKVTASVFGTLSDGTSIRCVQSKFDVTVSDYDTHALAASAINELKPQKVGNASVYTISYATSGGEPLNLQIVVAQNPETIRDLVSIPKKYVLFNWNDKWPIVD